MINRKTNSALLFLFGIIEIISFISLFFFESIFSFGDNLPIFNFIIFQFGLIFLLITLCFSRMQIEISGLYSELIGLKNSVPYVKVLSQDEFYLDFHAGIAGAKRTIYVTNLDVISPKNYSLPSSVTGRYYKDFVNQVKSRKEVVFRRVERVSEDKISWIEELVSKLDGRQNFSLAVMEIEEEPAKLPHVSVQIIDASEVYLVALTHHTAEHGPRDLKISQEESATIWRTYFGDHLWKTSKLVVDKGTVNWDILSEIRGKYRT